MRILIACEFSGIVRDEFFRRGHKATSCDIIESENWFVAYAHIMDDVRNHLRENWDMMIAFPPCTYLCSSGARWWDGRQAHQDRALAFVRTLMNAPIPRICIENPIGRISTAIGKPDQIIQPWQFGHGETKATCLWLKNLPKLKPTNIVAGRENKVHRMSEGPNRAQERSRTYQGIAEAMAKQWGN